MVVSISGTPILQVNTCPKTTWIETLQTYPVTRLIINVEFPKRAMNGYDMITLRHVFP